MLPDVIVHKSDMSVVKGIVGRGKMVSVKGELVNRFGPTGDREGMDTLSMAVSIVGRRCFGVPSPLGS